MSVALNLPLTTSNALDVWNPLGSNLTSPAVLRQLYSNNNENTNFNTTNQTRLTFQGPVFNVPAGEVKVAVGAEYFWHDQTQKISGSNNTGPTTTGSNFRVYNYDRNVKSAFAEVLLPVISSEMGIPFVHQFDREHFGPLRRVLRRGRDQESQVRVQLGPHPELPRCAATTQAHSSLRRSL